MKRVIALALALVTCLSLCSCIFTGKDNDNVEDGEIECPNCGKWISVKAIYCEYCGVPLRKESEETLTEAVETQTEEAELPSENEMPLDGPAVMNATEYEKDVIPVTEYDDPEWLHRVYIPKLNSPTENAASLNQKIYDKYVVVIDQLKNNEEENYIYDIDYEYKVHESVVGISVILTIGPQCAGYWMQYDFYYYDLKNDREISFEEYLQILGTDKSTVLENMKHSAAYSEISEYLNAPPELLQGIFDEKSASLLIKGVEWIDTDTACFEFDENLI